MKVILASKSPRRKEIFGAYAEECGFRFDIITRETDEELFGEHPMTGVKTLAERKGAAVAAEYPDALVVSSDTLVELGGKPLGKPVDVKYVSANVVAVIMPFSAVITGIVSVILGMDSLSSTLLIGAALGLVASFMSSAGDILENKKAAKESAQ